MSGAATGDDRLHFEDFEAGQVYEGATYALSEEEILRFAGAYDPQPMHLDRAAAAASMLGGVAASGWHVCALTMRLYFDGVMARTNGLGSPGIEEVRWRRPARAGSVLALRIEITGARESQSRPTTGLVGFALDLTDAETGETVSTQRFSVLIARREPGRPAKGAPKSKGPKPAEAIPTPSAGALDYATSGDVRIGATADLGTETLDAERIIGFARLYDPQPFHLDRAAGEASLFGGLAASGWQTTALWMRRYILGRLASVGGMTPERRARAMAAGGPGLGVRDLRWRRPALEGDRLRFLSTPRALSPFAAKPGWSLLTLENLAVNQRGEIAMSMTLEALIGDG
ncbi:MAG: MaoC/PaaZ C-terminal domain-containing protein [Pseudomonadota bacterium]